MTKSSVSLYCLALLLGLSVFMSACSQEPATLDTEMDLRLTSSPPMIAETVDSKGESLTPEVTAATEAYQRERASMVEQTIVSRGVTNEDVLRAMRTVPRHEFVPYSYLKQAYDDHPIPIGYGQTISQPYIVAWMTEMLELEAGDKVLEIGTGSGYQAAVLAELGDIAVHSIEIVPELALLAAERLTRLGYDRVHVKEGNGYFGWEEHAPYDAIIVTAAPDHLPQALVQQLVGGGALVIPIGPPGGYQSLWQFVKTGDSVQARNLGGVMFVPFTGGGVGDSSPGEP